MAREITGEFVCETHPEWGTLGLRPAWMPHADPMPGMAVAHDLLEHSPGDDGGIEAELQALGASFFIRGYTDYHASKGQAITDHAAHVAADFGELFRHFRDEGFTLLDPGEVDPLSDSCIDGDLARAIHEGCAEIAEENERYEDEDEDGLLEAFCSTESQDRMLGWMRKGYAGAIERFEDACPHDLVDEVFLSIETRIDEWLGKGAAEGMRVFIAINIDELTASIEVGFDGVDWIDCPDCGGDGEIAGVDLIDCEICQGGTIKNWQNCRHCKGQGYFEVEQRETCEGCNGERSIQISAREPI